MRNYKIYLVALVLSLLFHTVNAQTINWASLKEGNRHIITANFGSEYGIVYGLGYGYHIKTELFDIVPNFEFSFPSGNKILDEFKTKPGVLIRWYEFNNFQFSTRTHGIFRRYENDFVRMLNFGSDLAGIIGYYHPKWFASGEFGFDKAIVTHFKHSELYKSRYPDVKDGWYEPTPGETFILAYR